MGARHRCLICAIRLATQPGPVPEPPLQDADAGSGRGLGLGNDGVSLTADGATLRRHARSEPGSKGRSVHAGVAMTRAEALQALAPQSSVSVLQLEQRAGGTPPRRTVCIDEEEEEEGEGEEDPEPLSFLPLLTLMLHRRDALIASTALSTPSEPLLACLPSLRRLLRLQRQRDDDDDEDEDEDKDKDNEDEGRVCPGTRC